MRVEIEQGQKQQADGRTKHEAGGTPETMTFGALLSATLWELLAIGLVSIATYLIVSLILWIASIL